VLEKKEKKENDSKTRGWIYYYKMKINKMINIYINTTKIYNNMDRGGG
jgi:hypothetical protein